ncbi:MAG: hypothetical protein AAFV07_10555, partial [Bacteroidota bacterium]
SVSLEVEEEVYVPPYLDENQFLNLSISSFSTDDQNNEINFTLANSYAPSSGNAKPVSASLVITLQNNYTAYGGGIRVKAMTVKESQTGPQYRTEYAYTDALGSSGVTSYRPPTGNRFIPYPFEIPGPGVMYGQVTTSSYDAADRLRGQTVATYETLDNSTTITDDKEFNLGSHFNVDDIVGSNNYYATAYNTANTSRTDHIYRRVSKIHDYTSRLGRPLTVEQKSPQGITLAKVSYSYEDNNSFLPGQTEETHREVKRYHIPATTPFSNYYFTAATRIYYPSYLKEVVTKTQGKTTKVSYSNYDPYTGAPLTVIQDNGQGELYKSESDRLHKQTGYGNIGSRVTDHTYKNFMNLSGYQKTSISRDQGASWQVLGASAQSMKDSWTIRYQSGSTASQTGIWRPWKRYAWKGFLQEDGSLASAASFPDFDFSLSDAALANQGWLPVSEVSLYDDKGFAIESFAPLSGRYSGAKYGYLDKHRRITEAGNARYVEFAYSGAESYEAAGGYLGGDVRNGNGVRYEETATRFDAQDEYNEQVKVHTGDFSIRLPSSGNIGFWYQQPIVEGGSGAEGLRKDRKYRASVWVRNETLGNLPYGAELVAEVVSGGNQGIIATAIPGSSTFHTDSWYLLELDINLSDRSAGEELKIYVRRNGGGTIYADDFRFHPLDVPITTYVYDQQTGGIRAVLDGDNLATLSRPDLPALQRWTYQETPDGFRKVAAQRREFARDVE